MAEAAEQQPQPKSKGLLWMMIAIFMFLLLMIGGGVTFFLMSGEETPEQEEQKEKATKKPAIYFELERFVVNIAKVKRAKYLQVNMQIMVRDPKVVEQVKLHMPKIRNNLIFLLSNQDATTISNNEGKEKLRQEALAEIQKVLEAEMGKAGVEDLYFTSFIMQ